MSLTPGRKPSAGQRRRSVGTSGGSGRCSHSDASNTNTYPLSVREGSPTARTHPGTPRRQVKHATCSDAPGVRPPPPELYLTPLQQKEVCIRHLRARLRDNVDRLQHRECELGELRTQLCRMQEDWIEEECRRVEAQLALKEARREIQHLHRVVRTTNLSPREHDLLLLPSDLRPPWPAGAQQQQAQQGASPGGAGRSRSCGCSPAGTLSRSAAAYTTRLSSDALGTPPERSGGHAPESPHQGGAAPPPPPPPPRAEGRTHLLLEAALLSEQQQQAPPGHGSHSAVAPPPPRSYTYERLCSGGAVLPVSHSCHSLGGGGGGGCGCGGRAYLPHHHLFLHLPQEEAPAAAAAAPLPVPAPAAASRPEVRSQACSPTITWLSEDELSVITLATTAAAVTPPAEPPSSPPPLSSSSSSPPAYLSSAAAAAPRRSPRGVEPPPPPDRAVEMTVVLTVAQTCQPAPGARPPAVEEEEEEEEEEGCEGGPPQRSHWSRYFLVDLLALAAPVVPTVAWLCRGAPRDVPPVYHIGSLLRGCCAVALHSLRRAGGGGRGGRGPAGVSGATSI